MAKELLYEDDARAGLSAGIHKLASTVKVTLGPRGRYVALDSKWGSPAITNDGVTVAKQVELANQVENMGAKLVLEAAEKTNELAGDGTTTACLLADVFVQEGLRMVAAGADPLAIRRGIEKGVVATVKAIKEEAVQITEKDQVRNIAFISSGDEQVGETIATAVDAVGGTGGIACVDSQTMGVEVEVVKGLRYKEGYVVDAMVTDHDNNLAELENPLILITDYELMAIEPLIPILEQVVQAKRDLFIISDDLRREALHTIMLNTVRGTFRTVATECPEFKERRTLTLEDIAIVTGGTFISKDLKMHLEDITLDMLGSADRVVCSKDDTIIIGGHGDPEAIKRRIENVEREVEETMSYFMKERFEERLQRLRGGVATIKIGAASESELKEMKSRMEDALCATKAAMEEGVVAGGGIALMNAAHVLDDVEVSDEERIGLDIVRKALEYPLRTIAQNSGYEGSIEANLVREAEAGWGRDYKTGQLGNMMDMGIIDPAKVTRIALESASSVACLVLITESTSNEILVNGVNLHAEPDPNANKLPKY
ncbi:MAG: chaperonin GroEL [Eggerthellaceae bacterium]|nr:chaperonin GroEL [Eggerthellaceae bacterium]